MNFTFYGHACFSVRTEGKTLLFDPFITPNEQAAHVNVDQIVADYVLISHGHEDHVADAEVAFAQVELETTQRYLYPFIPVMLEIDKVAASTSL